MRYNLDAIAAKLGVGAKQADSFFDFNNVEPPATALLERALTAPVHSEGADDITRFEAASSAIGHFVRMIREGKMDEAQAWQATQDWNVATLVPPWAPERLRNDFDRLRRRDIETHGPITPVTPALSFVPASGWELGAWRADRYIGTPPERKWLVEGVVPGGSAGLFAAVGDAGKSMMALQLALYVAAYPKPQNKDFGYNDAPQFLGGPVLERGAAVMLTSEDDEAEVHRRLHALDPSNARQGKPLYVVPMVSAGGARAILAEGQNGPTPTEFWYTLRAQLIAIPDLKFVILDPLSSFVAGDTNDNSLGTALMAMLGELAATTGATVMVIHHFAKGKVPSNLSDAREAIRGAGAFVDNGRWAIVLWEMDEKTAPKTLKLLGQGERSNQAGVIYRGGVAKSNAPAAKTIRTLLRNPKTGLLEDMTDALIKATPKNTDVESAVLNALRSIKKDDPRFSFPKGKTALYEQVWDKVKKHGVPELSSQELCDTVQSLIDQDLIVETADRGKKPRYEPKQS